MKNFFLPKEIWYEICQFCENGVVMYYFLIEKNETFLIKFMQEMVCNWLQREYFGEYFEEFCQELIESRGIIAGSFIASTLCGEVKNNSDIDIFIPINKKKEYIKQLLLDENLLNGMSEASGLLEWFYQTNDTLHMSNDDSYEWNDIANVYTTQDSIVNEPDYLKRKITLNKQGQALKKLFRLLKHDDKTDEEICDLYLKILNEEPNQPLVNLFPQKRKIQLIFVHCENLQDWLIQNSDVDLFKTMYNGQNLIFGSMIPMTTTWHQQSIMPHHQSFDSMMNSFAKKILNYRFRETTHSFKRLFEFLKFKDTWSIQYDIHNLWRCLVEVREFTSNHGENQFYITINKIQKPCKNKTCHLHVLNRVHEHENQTIYFLKD